MIYIKTKDNCVYKVAGCDASLQPEWYYVHGGTRDKRVFKKDLLEVYYSYEEALPHIKMSNNLLEDYCIKSDNENPHWVWD